MSLAKRKLDKESSEIEILERMESSNSKGHVEIFPELSRELTGAPLYVHKDTLNCALQNLCVPCLYKLSPTGQFGEIRCAPNQRPESCPRATLPSVISSRDVNVALQTRTNYRGLYTLHTSRSEEVKHTKDQVVENVQEQTILTVGDGDLSFSLSVARGVAAACAKFVNKSSVLTARSGIAGSGFQLTATTHESLNSLLRTYSDAASNIAALNALGVRVLHDVDATQLAISPVAGQKFDTIIWNFPCVGLPPKTPPTSSNKVSTGVGNDGQVEEQEQNQKLLSAFFQNAPKHLTATGEVHITHKTIEPFNWWNIPLINENSSSGLLLLGSIIFDRCLYPGYINRKVLHSKSFPCYDAHTYVFSAPPCAASHVDFTSGERGDGSSNSILQEPKCAEHGQIVRLHKGSDVLAELARVAATAGKVAAAAGKKTLLPARVGSVHNAQGFEKSKKIRQ